MIGAHLFQETELCGVGDVCRILDISRSAVRRILDEKRIPATLTSAGWIFVRSDVEEYQRLREAKAKKGDKRVKLKKTSP